jgi:hypothetical protein
MRAPSQRLRHPRRLPGFAALLGALLAPGEALAQTSTTTTPTGASATAPNPPPVAGPTPTEPPGSASVDEKLAKQQAEIDALLVKTKDQEKSVTALRHQAASASDEAPTKLLSFWGFSDLTFGGIFYPNDAAYKVASPYHSTFFSSGVNLYAKSEMTRTLSALIETQLTYTPNGFTDNYPTTVKIGSTTVQSLPGTAPPYTTVHGPYSQLDYRLDGIVIERAYMEWKPADWFGVRVGRFLTPFGIWNEDHGSPVLIGVDYPQFMNFNLVPLQQLGLEAFGNVGLGDDVRMEYAATLANSNGPSDEYKDLTNMKAVGARLKLVYTHDAVSFRLGGYAYYNKYVDSTDSFVVHLTPGLVLDNSVASPIGSSVQYNQSYDESIFTGDAEFRLQRFRLLGEFAHQTVLYNIPTQLGTVSQLLKGVPLNVNAYDPSHYGYGGYIMAAYEIPFHTKPLDFSVTPYAGYDYVIPSTTVQVESTTQIRGGLNVKPSPYVTLKVEVSRIIPEAKAVDSVGTAVFSQIAFSF